MRVTSEAGTDLTYRCGEYPVMSQYGMADEPGRFDHWGVGLLHTFPNEGSANGTVVFQPGDIVILPYCRYVQDPVAAGDPRRPHHAASRAASTPTLMRDWLAEGKTGAEDRDPYAVSHLGWGLNPQCRWDALALYGDAPERSRAAARSFPGNFLFSTGPNTQGGGKRTTRGHYDVPMRDCTVALDGNVVVEDGRIVDPKMIVAARRALSADAGRHADRGPVRRAAPPEALMRAPVRCAPDGVVRARLRVARGARTTTATARSSWWRWPASRRASTCRSRSPSARADGVRARRAARKAATPARCRPTADVTLDAGRRRHAWSTTAPKSRSPAGSAASRSA